MTNKHELILKLKGISREMKETSIDMRNIYGAEYDSTIEIFGAANIVDDWILGIKKEIENDK